ncbi:MAG: GNAT family N-acetyltransferase [Candidatus Hodarchaeales archaeon]
MIELDPKDFSLVLPHLSELHKYNYILRSVIDGSVAGRIFVNDMKDIRTVLLWDKTNCAGIYIEGHYSPEIANEMNKIILGKIIPEGNEIADIKDATNCYAPDHWENKFQDEVLKGVHSRNYERIFLKFDKGIHKPLKWRDKIPPGFKMIQFDENLYIFKDKELKNLDTLISDIRYSEDKFGACLIDEKKNAIISSCTTDWSSGKHVEFGVKTNEEYRKRGFGSACAASAIEFAMERGYEHLGWHCWSDNIASAKTAQKAGYIEERVHPVIHFWYNSYDNLLLQSISIFRKKDYKEALYFHKLIEQMKKDETEAYKAADLVTSAYQKRVYLRAAICYAKLKNLNEAIQSLKEILDCEHDDSEDFLNRINETIASEEFKDSEEGQAILKEIQARISQINN